MGLGEGEAKGRVEGLKAALLELSAFCVARWLRKAVSHAPSSSPRCSSAAM